jgi:sugar lactone lactonase YvrE
MRSRLTCCALSIIAAAALLAGCGGSQPPIGAPGAKPQAPATQCTPIVARCGCCQKLRTSGYKAAAPLLYATNDFNSDNWDGVTVYRASAKDPAPLARISDGLELPFGACIDGQGTLYVTNLPASGGWISEYALGKTTPTRIITDGANSPAYCAIDASGNLWVANYAGPNVTEYLKGSKKPHAVITKGLEYPVGVAIDHTGNLYVGNFYSSSGNVQVYAPGSKSPSRTITDGVTSPRGLAVDSSGTLYVANAFENNIEEYRSGKSDPFQAITLGLDGPAGVTVDKKGILYASNIGNSTVVEFAPESLKPLKKQISKDLYEPNGVAYYPPLLP